MTTQKVSTEDLIKSMEYLEIEIPQDLRKSLESSSMEGSEQNGGGSEPNDLQKRKQEVQEKLKKAKEEVEELEKANKEMEEMEGSEEGEKGKGEEGSGEGEEENKAQPSMEGKELKKSLQEISELKTTVSHLTTLVKSQHSTLQNLSTDIDSLLSNPQERRSASGIDILRKSMQGENLEDKGEKGSGRRINILQKGRVSQALMDVFIQGGSKDEFLADAIVTYESSSYLSPSIVDFMKGKGIEIEVIK